MLLQDDFEMVINFYVAVEIDDAGVTKSATISGLKITILTTKAINCTLASLSRALLPKRFLCFLHICK